MVALELLSFVIKDKKIKTRFLSRRDEFLMFFINCKIESHEYFKVKVDSFLSEGYYLLLKNNVMKEAY